MLMDRVTPVLRPMKTKAIKSTFFSAACLFLLMLQACGDGSEPSIRITAEEHLLPVGEDTCIALSVSADNYQPGRPDIGVSIGDIRDIEGGGGKWTARLCSGNTTGKIKFSVPGYEISEASEIWSVPKDPRHFPDQFPVTSFTATISKGSANAWINSVDVMDAHSVSTDVYLYPPTPFLFEGDTVTLGIIAEGSGLPVDLQRVSIVIGSLSPPSAKLIEPEAVDENGRPYYHLGGFLNTEKALLVEWGPSSWGAPVIFDTGDADTVTVTGTVEAVLPHVVGGPIFNIQPYLTNVSQNSMEVRWETDREARTLVAYGKSPQCEMVAMGSVDRMRNYLDYDVTFPREINSVFHKVTLRDLEPDTGYYYRIIGMDEPTSPQKFRTAPLPGGEFTFLVIGDTRTDHSEHREVIDAMTKEDFRLYLHTGDLVGPSDLMQWLIFHEIENPLSRKAPIMPVIGNHDLGGMNKFYKRYFHPGEPAVDPADGHVFSFDYGGVHFAAIATNYPGSTVSAQYQWLENDLAAADMDPDIKFKVVFHHYPLISGFDYLSYTDGETYLMPLFLTYGVNAVFAGHVHSYERSDIAGMAHVTTGGGGASLRHENLDPANNPYLVRWLTTYHYVKVNVTGDSMEMTAIDKDGVIIDSFSVPAP